MSERKLPRLHYIGDVVVGVASDCSCEPIEVSRDTNVFAIASPPHESHDIVPPRTENEMPEGVDFEDYTRWCRMFAASPDLLAVLVAPTWLVWSNEHAAWWCSARCGYTWDIAHAGRYSLEEAIAISGERGVKRGDGINPPELIQPSPEWLAARAAAIAKAKGAPTLESVAAEIGRSKMRGRGEGPQS
jgi:hypothetical protein